MVTSRTKSQLEAADPNVSSWVFASAGSGKTTVLRDRVLRLLLQGVSPEDLLCLTFTKAAAAEMKNRISAELAEWASLKPEDLWKGHLSELLDRRPTRDEFQLALQLFARVLDVPGRLPIMTIHAFCQSILRRFPIEAGLLPHFDPMDEKDANLLREEAWQDLLADISIGKDEDLKRAFGQLVDLGEKPLKKALKEITDRTEQFHTLLGMDPSYSSFIRAYSAILKVQPQETASSIIAAACKDFSFAIHDLRQAVRALRKGGIKSQDRAARLEGFFGKGEDQRADSWMDYCQAYFTKTGEILKQLTDKASAKAMEGLEDLLQQEARRILDVQARIRLVAMRDCSASLAFIAIAIQERYEKRKRREAKLDFEDLILHTQKLLSSPGIAPWILYKLDGKLRHILIDEAQDTNDPQWQIIKALSEEFFAGEGKAQEGHRTLFAVGDLKQSIYGFQGADPQSFLRSRDHFQVQIRPEDKFRPVSLNTSFRSSPLILHFVDQVFKGKEKVLAGEKMPISHIPHKPDKYGEIRLWPLAFKAKKDNESYWPPAATGKIEAGPAERLAQKIAAEIKGLVKAGVGENDIMVLVRQRNEFVTALVRELKKQAIAVSGLDRLNLIDDIAIQDLLAFAEFLLMPEDDYTLACLLKSPLFGLDDGDLLAIAPDRGETSLWEMLGRSEAAKHREAHDQLGTYLASADFMPPFQLYSDLLKRDGGRKKFAARLGGESLEAIDEFLTLILQYEANHIPSLQGLVHWLRSGENIVKRDLDDKAIRNVRIMTIHGAKGSEAPIVFLVEYQGKNNHQPKIFWHKTEKLSFPLWAPRKETHSLESKAAKEKADVRAIEEEQRLLYVGLTRAMNRLYLCAWTKQQKGAKESWHRQWSDALAGVKEPAWPIPSFGEGWEGEGTVMRYGTVTTTQGDTPLPPAPLPQSLVRSLPLDERVRLLSPSRLTDAPLARQSGGDRSGAKRGTIIHQLLQILPDVPADRRLQTAQDYLRRNHGSLSDSQIEEITAETLSVLHHAEFSFLFEGEALMEVPVAGHVRLQSGQEVMVMGRIDRVVIRDDECFILDFKSHRLAPRHEGVIPLAYLRQMGLYRTLFHSLYPKKIVQCLLLWTAGPVLMRVSAENMDRALSEMPRALTFIDSPPTFS